MSTFIVVVQWAYLIYFISISTGYLTLNLLSFVAMRRYFASRPLDHLPPSYSGIEPPVSIIVPAYNEEKTIVQSIKSLLQLDYPDFEILVINDGSSDGTLATLQSEFALQPFPEAYWARLKSNPVRTIYRSPLHTNLRIIDKENGGKADALNVGLNAARYPLFCAVDADSILQRNSLRRVLEPFLEDPHTVASGGTVRVANGCEVSGGFMTRIDVPKKMLPLIQTVEYLRAFLFGRLGWTVFNSVLVISGAFGLFRKEAVIEAGGYKIKTIGEDMEVVVRLHRLFRARKKPYSVHFTPEPVCWTEAPESLKVLRNQRIRWQRGLAESLVLNRALLFSRNGGGPGWLAFTFMAIFEWWGPLFEILASLFMTFLFVTNNISGVAFLTFIALEFALGLLLSMSALLLEEISFHLYPNFSHIGRLMMAAVIENFGYRQINTVWRLIGLWRWLIGTKASWGNMTRTGSWNASVDKN